MRPPSCGSWWLLKFQTTGRRKTCPSCKGVLPKLNTLFLLLFHWPNFSYITPICQLSSLCLSRPTAFSSSSVLRLGKLRGPHRWEIVTSDLHGSTSDNRDSSRRLEKLKSEVRVFISLVSSLQGCIGLALSLNWGLLAKWDVYKMTDSTCLSLFLGSGNCLLPSSY